MGGRIGGGLHAGSLRGDKIVVFRFHYSQAKESGRLLCAELPFYMKTIARRRVENQPRKGDDITLKVERKTPLRGGAHFLNPRHYGFGAGPSDICLTGLRNLASWTASITADLSYLT